MRRLRHDVNFLVSLGLLVAAAVTAVTGLIADVWDLNDFWYHTVAGYVMGALAVSHVLLNWRTLTGYARFRLTRRGPRMAGGAARSPEEEAPAGRARAIPAKRSRAQPGGADARGLWPAAMRAAVSRRGLLGAAVAGAGGWLLGRGLRPAPQIPAGSDVGVVYHEWSKPGIIDVLGTVENWGGQPPLYKDYPGAPRVALPEPRLDGAMPLDLAIASRRSVRDYAAEPTTLEELSRLLFLTGGISTDEWGHLHRTAPSSGALYPIEIYPVVHNVAGLEPGVYHYGYERHELRLVRAGDLRARVVEQGIGQEFLGQCAAVLFLTQILQRMRFKYQDRSYRYGLLEAGHLGENLYLAATAAGLGACGIGAFMDDDMNAMLGVDGLEEAVVYMLAVGRRRSVA